MTLRLVFMGTPEFAVPSLQALLDSGHAVVGVYSQPPKPKGRGHVVQPSPVHQVAEAAGVPVFTPKTLRPPEAQAEFAALKPDLVVVAAYGLILPKPVLDAARITCVNVHGSLLPRWRGAAPMQRALLAGDTETGICLMQMEEGLDTGGVYIAEKLPITPRMTATELHDQMAALGGALLHQHLEAIAAGQLLPAPQPSEGVTYAAKLTKADGWLNWQSPALQLDRQVRALTPWPGCTFTLGDEVIKVLVAEPASGHGAAGALLDANFTVACGEGALRLITVQRPGRGPVSGAECWRALKFEAGQRLPLEAPL